jgi:REP element-mobilizing transposase RayT
VFSTGGRRPVLHEELRESLFAYLAGTLKGDGAVPICVGGYSDHVHAVFRLSRTRSLAETTGTVKAASSKWLKVQDPRLHDFAWQAGYAAFSVGRSEIDAVVRYVQNQAEHHGQLGFQDEMRRFFAEYDIEYDERYVWE